MANNKANKAAEENTIGLKQEIVGLIIGAVAILVAASLLSSGKSSNWIGTVGGVISWFLTLVLGYASYVVPLILAFLAVKLIFRRVINLSLASVLGLMLILISLSGLLAVYGGLASIAEGGRIGNFLYRILSTYIGMVGTIIVLGTVFIIGAVTTTGVSFAQAVAKMIYHALGGLIGIVRFIYSLVAGGEEPQKKKPAKKEKAKEEKKRKKEPAIISKAPEPKPELKPAPAAASEGEVSFSAPTGTFKLPDVDLLDEPSEGSAPVDEPELIENSKVLAQKLHDFDVEGHVVEVRPGPIVTMYEFEPATGIKVGKITNLANDLAMAMRATSIRIIAPIPGKSVVGIEIPNEERARVSFREMLECSEYRDNPSKLTIALGRDISGAPVVSELTKMPHLLIAGATGTGKSVFVNSLITSVLFKATPEDVRFLMIDPKMLELSAYEGIPHLLSPVITDPKKATAVLKTIVAEMGKRYKVMADLGAKNIDGYNRLVEEREAEEKKKSKKEKAAEAEATGAGEEAVEHRRLPFIVVVIDELADLMMTSGKEVEECLVRLSQMARASGIHLVLATQRPSVDVITGLIKTNFPSRISFKVPSKTDSRTILDSGGAETLLGEGDLLMLPPGTARLKRVHAPYISEVEIKAVTDFIKKQGTPAYDTAITEAKAVAERAADEEDLGEEFLRRYDEAVEMALEMDMISTSYIQRRFRIGYNTAARIIEKKEADGIVGPSQGSRPREVIKRGQV